MRVLCRRGDRPVAPTVTFVPLVLIPSVPPMTFTFSVTATDAAFAKRTGFQGYRVHSFPPKGAYQFERFISYNDFNGFIIQLSPYTLDFERIKNIMNKFSRGLPAVFVPGALSLKSGLIEICRVTNNGIGLRGQEVLS